LSSKMMTDQVIYVGLGLFLGRLLPPLALWLLG
jgi:hypothetical protein